MLGFIDIEATRCIGYKVLPLIILTYRLPFLLHFAASLTTQSTLTCFFVQGQHRFSPGTALIARTGEGKSLRVLYVRTVTVRASFPQTSGLLAACTAFSLRAVTYRSSTSFRRWGCSTHHLTAPEMYKLSRLRLALLVVGR